jgi:hypothetical protein
MHVNTLHLLESGRGIRVNEENHFESVFTSHICIQLQNNIVEPSEQDESHGVGPRLVIINYAVIYQWKRNLACPCGDTVHVSHVRFDQGHNTAYSCTNSLANPEKSKYHGNPQPDNTVVLFL